MSYLSHHLTKTYSDCYQFQRTQKKKKKKKKKLTLLLWSTLLLLYANFSAHELFSQWHFVFLKKNVPRGTLKKELNRTLSLFFINLLLFVFLYICMYYISLFVFCSFVLWDSWPFFHFLSLTILCIEYQVFHTWNSGANLCREEENLIFVSARYLIQHWISPNQDDLSHSARTFISG